MIQLGARWGLGGKVLLISLPGLFKLFPEKERKTKKEKFI